MKGKRALDRLLLKFKKSNYLLNRINSLKESNVHEGLFILHALL